MALSIGIGLGAGRLLIGYAPDTGVDAPAVALSASAGIVAAPVAETDPLGPLTIVTSRAPQLALSADVGITLAPGVAQWDDFSGNTRHLSQATGGLQPPRTAGALNGRAVVQFTAHALGNAWLPPAPGTTPTFFYAVMRAVTLVNGNTLFSSGGGRFKLSQSTANRHAIANTASGNLVTSTANTWNRWRALFNNATTDYLRIGATTQSGTNTGNNAGSGGFFLGASSIAAALPAALDVAALFAWAGEPSAPELAACDAWVTARYGGGVGL
jgi:hypothetical protein